MRAVEEEAEDPGPDEQSRQSAKAKRAQLAAAKENAQTVLAFSLSKQEQNTCHERMQTAKKEGLLPSGIFSSAIWGVFKKPGSCNTHDQVLLSGPLGMYALHGLLSKNSRRAVSMLLEAVGRLWAKSFERDDLLLLEQLVQRALVQIQIQLPASQDIVVHMVHHLASGIKVNGPPFASSMWPFERACNCFQLEKLHRWVPWNKIPAHQHHV